MPEETKKQTEGKKESPKEKKKEILTEKEEDLAKEEKKTTKKNDKKETKPTTEKPAFEKSQVAKTKEEKKPAEKPKPKKPEKPKAVNKIEKTKEQKKLQEKIKEKKVPVIRGNFGKAWLRRKAIKKWQKWRKPRGIDFRLKKENGAKPKMGFRSPAEIRGLHPSGLQEVYVRNLNELKEIKEKNKVIRLNGNIGKKKKKEILKKAKEKKMRILN